jgi:hypothetical protein
MDNRRPRTHPHDPMRHITPLILLVIASPTFAQIHYVSQTRSIEAFAGFDPPQTVSATDSLAFDQSLDISGLNPDGQPPSNGFASQHSELLPAGIVMSGRLGGTDNYRFGGSGEGAGYSLLDVTFSLAQPMPFHLTASESDNPSAATQWSVTLSQGSTRLFGWEATPFSSLSIAIDGTLPPGTYTLRGAWYDGWQGAGTGTRFSNYALAFNVPEPGLLVSFIPLLFLRRRDHHANA